MILAHLVKIFSAMIGIGRRILLLETGGLITGKLRDKMLPIRYHSTTRFWALTGNVDLLIFVTILSIPCEFDLV